MKMLMKSLLLLLNVYQSKRTQQCHHKAATWILQRRTIDRSRQLYTKLLPQERQQSLSHQKRSDLLGNEKLQLTHGKRILEKSYALVVKSIQVPRVGKKFQREMLSPHVRTADLNVYQCFQKRTERKYLIHLELGILRETKRFCLLPCRRKENKNIPKS